MPTSLPTVPRLAMRLALDATPLLGQRSGVGRYLSGLLEGMSHLPDAPEARLTLFSIRGAVPVPLPPRTTMAPRRAPARLLNKAWRVAPFPPVELLTGGIDVFHGTNFVLPPLARAGGVLTVHDLTYLRFPETVDSAVAAYRHLVPRALARAARVVAVSHAMAEEIRAEYDLDPGRVVVAPLGVDPAWSAATPPDRGQRLALGLPERYVLFVGNQEPRKNLGMLVRAHAAARAADRDVPPLVVVGPLGWGDAWDGRRPDSTDVVFPGYLSDTDLRAVVAGADAVCAPSRYEGFGLPVLEALATGTAVLASDIPAHREVAGGLADLVPVGDVDAWAHALGRVRHAEETTTEQAHSRRVRSSRFTWERCAERHLEAYEAAAAGR